ncbi:ribosomal RNA small subunit methyltransferase I [Clostridia bacterium]|nr:ribosomal RNA small subunit methyltransferase I [Clostridia bacterium]
MTLYVVGTPIGNLSDASPRVIDTLRNVSFIAAEDTRVTQKLLSRFDIHTKLTSSHEHNERGKARLLVERMLSDNADAALVTDAGMPSISDPGGAVVTAARVAGIRVECVPGPTAATTILALTGWRFTEFAFYGFLPREKAALREKLAEMSSGVGVAVVYESPHRVGTLLTILNETAADARVFIANDLTKQYEWTFEGTAGESLAAFSAKANAEKGEYCLAFQFPLKPSADEPEPIRAETWVLDALYSGKTMAEAVEWAREHGASRNAAYQAGLAVKAFLRSGA